MKLIISLFLLNFSVVFAQYKIGDWDKEEVQWFVDGEYPPVVSKKEIVIDVDVTKWFENNWVTVETGKEFKRLIYRYVFIPRNFDKFSNEKNKKVTFKFFNRKNIIDKYGNEIEHDVKKYIIYVSLKSDEYKKVNYDKLNNLVFVDDVINFVERFVEIKVFPENFR